MLKILFSCLEMSVFLLLFNYINIFILIISSASIYFASIYLLRLLDDDDMMLIKQVLKIGRPMKEE